MRIPHSSQPWFQVLIAIGATASILKLLADPGTNERMRWLVIFIAGMIIIRSLYMLLKKKEPEE